MRFAFAGIDFLGDVFLTLLERGWEPVKLFTRPCDGIYDFNDTVVARARALKVPIQLSRIRTPDLAALRNLGCEALIVAGYPWLIRGWEEHLPYGANVHPSPLPLGRGPYPLFQAILEDRVTWGITAHALAPSFDTGSILAQETFAIAPTETHDSLLAKCQMGAKRLAVTLSSDMAGLWAAAEPQTNGSYWPRISETQRTIDWSRTVADAMRVVRAFGTIEAVAVVDGSRLFVRAASGWTEPHRYRPGTLVQAHRRHLVVAVRDGFVQVTQWSAISPEKAREVGR